MISMCRSCDNAEVSGDLIRCSSSYSGDWCDDMVVECDHYHQLRMDLGDGYKSVPMRGPMLIDGHDYDHIYR